jgi:MFS family permease
MTTNSRGEYDDATYDDTVAGRRVQTDHTVETYPTSDQDARDRFGGLNAGAVFFGWLVAIGVSILLTGIVAAVGSTAQVSQSDAQRQAGTIGIVTAVVLICVLLLGYYAGGYVAGRMSRFDGGRQGFGVWLLGLVITIVAVVLGAVFGAQYNVLDRVSLPRLPIGDQQLTGGGILAAIVVLAVTLLAALVGGKVGHHYHNRVDRAVRNSGSV